MDYSAFFLRIAQLESVAARLGSLVEQIQRKSRVRERTPHNAPRIRAGLEKKDQKAESKKNQMRRRYAVVAHGDDMWRSRNTSCRMNVE